MTDLQIAQKYINLANSAKSRGKEFNLTITSIRNLLSAKKCYYTGLPLTNESRTIDRIDNNKGYVKGNVCACHVRINLLKADLSISDIIRLAKKLDKFK